MTVGHPHREVSGLLPTACNDIHVVYPTTVTVIHWQSLHAQSKVDRSINA